MNAADVESKTVALSSGYKIGYSLYGSQTLEKVVFYFHGFPGSRLEAAYAHEAARALGISVVALDRPGFGLSDHQPRRSLLDWPRDVLQVADALSVKRFAVLAVSGGAPYAAACAHSIRDRLILASVVSGVAPIAGWSEAKGVLLPARLLVNLGVAVPFLANPAVRCVAWGLRVIPGSGLKFLRPFLGRADRAVLERPEIVRLLRENVDEALKNGSGPAVREFKIITSPWGFSLEDIAARVEVWHGLDDRYLPAGMGRYVASRIKGARPTFVPDQGHFMIFSIVGEILRSFGDLA